MIFGWNGKNKYLSTSNNNPICRALPLEGSASNEKFDLGKAYSCPKKGVHYRNYY